MELENNNNTGGHLNHAGSSEWSLASTSSDLSDDSSSQLRWRGGGGGNLGGNSNNSSSSNCLIRWYARFLVKFPYIIPILIVMVAVTCGVLSYKYHPLPDFGEDPVKGIETRGTPIRRAWSTAMSMYHNLETGDTITSSPNLTMALANVGVDHPIPHDWLRQGTGKRKRRDAQFDTRDVPMSTQGNRCAERIIDPSTNVKFALESTGSSDLFSYKSLSDMCQLEARYLTPILDEACPLMSLPYYVALLNGKWNCEDITETDVSTVAELLDRCAAFYLNDSLPSRSGDETKDVNMNIPTDCIRGNYVYNILHFLTNMKFYKEGNPPKRSRLRLTVMYWKREIAGHFDSTEFYKTYIENKKIEHGSVKVTALGLKDQLDVKYTLFAKYVLEDLLYFAIAGGIILFVMFIYLQSFVLILATVVNIAFSFVIAYFLYFFVCGLEFYPFINLLAGLVLVAVGADDVFIFHDCWLQFKRDPSLDMEEAVIKTLNHAALAIFVTSLTTASAFFSNMISCITSIQCFAIFAGIAVLVNFILMVTWTPSIIILCELCTKQLQKRCCFQHPNILRCFNEKLTQLSSFIFGKVFPILVEKAWFVWLIVLFALGAGSCVVVFVTPRLKLPSNADFQVFPSSNLLEHWDLVVATRIAGIKEQAMATNEEIPLDFLWGFKAEDKGDKLNPDDEPNTVTLDKHFDFYSEKSQIWLDGFCHNLLNASYADPRYTKYSVCTFDMYSMLLQEYCSRSAFQSGHYAGVYNTCCSDFDVPYKPSQLKQCFPIMAYIYEAHMTSYLGRLRNGAFSRLLGVPIFDPNNNVVGVNFHVKANYTMSLSYSTMKKRYHIIDNSLKTQLREAPKSLQGGFFSAETKFGFYDLQGAIATGTYYSIGLSLGVAFLVMLVTSRNILVCFYAILTITLAIASTVASIVMLGWSLNIIESITVSLAVGLSIDFTIHYGVAYRLSSEYDAKSRVNEAFERVGGAVAMAALTTFVAGAAVIPSRVLPYIKLGIFLMLCMTFSWIYATFFFQSLCRIAGPRGNFCQIKVRCAKKPTSSVYLIGSNESFDSGLIAF